MNQNSNDVDDLLIYSLLPDAVYSQKKFVSLLHKSDKKRIENFVKTNINLGTAPIAGFRLLQLNDNDIIQNLELHTLTNSYHARFAANTKGVKLYNSIQSVLQRAGIDAIGIKGIYLVKNIFTDIGMRAMLDLDILVMPHHFLDATFELMRLGMKMQYRKGLQTFKIPFTKIEVITDFIDYINRQGMREATLIDNRSGWFVEIQQSISRPGEPRGILDPAVFESANQDVPSPDMAFLISALDIFDKGRKSKLRTATDLLWILKQTNVSTDKILSTADNLGIINLAMFAFALIDEYLGIKLIDKNEPLIKKMARGFISADFSERRGLWRLSYLQKALLPYVISNHPADITIKKLQDILAFKILYKTSR